MSSDSQAPDGDDGLTGPVSDAGAPLPNDDALDWGYDPASDVSPMLQLEEALDAGRITQAQYDKLRQRIRKLMKKVQDDPRSYESYRPPGKALVFVGLQAEELRNEDISPKELRKRLRQAFFANAHVLEEIVQNTALPAPVRMQALEMMAKYGVGALAGQVDDAGNAVALPSVTVVERREG